MQYHKLLLGALLGLFQFAFFPLLASAATSISGTLFFDTTWTSFGSPYVIDGQFIIPKIPKGVTLTIEPGVVVKMGQPSCNCYATIFGFSGHFMRETLTLPNASSSPRSTTTREEIPMASPSLRNRETGV